MNARLATFTGMSRSALLTTRGHIDLLRVASAACCPGR
ncbi:putative leader peptide [Streptomyces sp. NPDC048201]